MTILVPGDRRTKEPTKIEKLLYQLAQSQGMIERMSLNLQNNLVAMKNILKVTDEQMRAELDRLNEEVKQKQEKENMVGGGVGAAIQKLTEPMPIGDSER